MTETPRVAETPWSRFLDQRPEYLGRLAPTIAAAVARTDTRHPAFHGCIDWHSSVHGTYALLVAGRMIGDRRYADAAMDALGPSERLLQEEADLRSGQLSVEVPYGLAWLLHLDVEAQRAGDTRFASLARSARDLLLLHLARHRRVMSGWLSPAYRNTIWATDALYRWAEVTGDTEAAARAADSAVDVLSTPALERFAALGSSVQAGFLSPAHLAVLLAMRTRTAADAVEPVLEVIRGSAPLAPDEMRMPHQAGLNFSRAWGSYAAWVLTGDAAFREDYVTLFTTHLAYTDYWRDDYDAHAHWVAQFGVFALDLTEQSVREHT